jgi:hypothetical protein
MFFPGRFIKWSVSAGSRRLGSKNCNLWEDTLSNTYLNRLKVACLCLVLAWLLFKKKNEHFKISKSYSVISFLVPWLCKHRCANDAAKFDFAIPMMPHSQTCAVLVRQRIPALQCQCHRNVWSQSIRLHSANATKESASAVPMML